MVTKAREQPEAVDIFKSGFCEYVDVKYYAEGERNDLGEPARTLTTRDSDVKCDIQVLVPGATYIRQAGIREQVRQGIIDQSTHIMFVNAGTTLLAGDVVTNYDGDNFDVLFVNDQLFTHKEAFLRRIS